MQWRWKMCKYNSFFRWLKDGQSFYLLDHQGSKMTNLFTYKFNNIQCGYKEKNVKLYTKLWKMQNTFCDLDTVNSVLNIMHWKQYVLLLALSLLIPFCALLSISRSFLLISFSFASLLISISPFIWTLDALDLLSMSITFWGENILCIYWRSCVWLMMTRPVVS